MTDNRTTVLLRRLLDERGVEHYDGTESTLWLKDEHGYRASADELSSGRLSVHIWCDTPEQAIAATLRSGTLTAEQIGEAIERNFMKICVLDDGKPVEWREDWVCRVGIDYRAIADELNAALGCGECEVECFDDGVDEGMDGEWFSYAPPTWYLSCGHKVQGDERPDYCVVCGRKVKR